MNLDRLRALVEHAVNTGAALADFNEDGLRLTIRAIAAEQDAAHEPDTTVSLESWRGGPGTIHSTQFGLFHLQPDHSSAPFVSLGQTVTVGQQIGLIEAMKVFSPVLSHRAGRIIAVLAEHGAEVERGQPLFHLE